MLLAVLVVDTSRALPAASLVLELGKSSAASLATLSNVADFLEIDSGDETLGLPSLGNLGI